jgi:hypothetical protein
VGTPLSIKKAKIRFGTIEKEMTVKAGSKSVDFIVDLPEGDTSLQTLLIDEGGQHYGAFYTYISRVR